VALYANKRWGELSEGERNIIVREGGILAARVTTSAKTRRVDCTDERLKNKRPSRSVWCAAI